MKSKHLSLLCTLLWSIMLSATTESNLPEDGTLAGFDPRTYAETLVPSEYNQAMLYAAGLCQNGEKKTYQRSGESEYTYTRIITFAQATALIDLLVAKGADINYYSKNQDILQYDGDFYWNYFGLLAAAANIENKEMVKYLIKKGLVCNNFQGKLALQLATYHKNIELCRLLIQSGVSPNDCACVCYAVNERCYALLDVFFQSGASPNIRNNDNVSNNGLMPIMCAVMNSDLKMVKYLVAKGAALDVLKKNSSYSSYNPQGNNLLQLAYNAYKSRSYPSNDVIKYLLSNGFNVNQEMYMYEGVVEGTLMTVADLETTKFLLQKGAKLTYRRTWGNSDPTFESVFDYTDLETTRYLLECGTPLNLTSSQKRDKIEKAIGNNDYQMVKMLLNKGFSTTYNEQYDDFEIDNVIRAVILNDMDTLNKYLTRDIDVNYMGSYVGYKHLTPLMWAAALDRSDAISALLKNGADPNVSFDDDNRFGHRALEIAISEGNVKSIALLESVTGIPRIQAE